MNVEKYITSSCLISNHTVYKNGECVFVNSYADLPVFLHTVYKQFAISYPRFYKMDSLCKLGWLASEILLKDNFQKERYRPEDTGVVLANTNASLDTDMKYMASTEDIPSPSLFVYTLPNIVAGEICIRNHFKGEDVFFVFDSFPAEFMYQYVSNLFNNNLLQACICGWVELLGDEYKAALFLVEKTKAEESMDFTKENMLLLFENKKTEAK